MIVRLVRPISASVLKSVAVEPGSMPSIELEPETIDRLDSLRIEDESYDEVITELINIYEAEELTLFRAE